MTDDFHGAKLAILSGERIVVILRDDIPTIPWPGHWDLPGGGREPGETPEETVLRETEEEIGVRFQREDLIWRAKSPSPPNHVWFFVTEQLAFDPNVITFGNEGQKWAFEPIDWYLGHPKNIPSQTARLAEYLKSRPARYQS